MNTLETSNVLREEVQILGQVPMNSKIMNNYIIKGNCY